MVCRWRGNLPRAELRHHLCARALAPAFRTTDGILLMTTFITRSEQACLVTNHLIRIVCDIFALRRVVEWAPAVSQNSIPSEHTHLHRASCALFVVAVSWSLLSFTTVYMLRSHARYYF